MNKDAMTRESKQPADHPFSHILSNRYKVRVVRNMILQSRKDRILDVGCGAGFMLTRLESFFSSAVGIDMSEDALAMARRYSKADFRVANAENLPFANESFDCVVSTDAFEHIPDDAAAAREIARVLKPGGIMVVYVPSRKGLLSGTKCASLYHEKDAGHLKDERYYTMESLKSMAMQAGLTVQSIGYHNVFFQELFTQILKWLSAKAGKRYRNQADIDVFLKSRGFPIYRWMMLPLIDIVVRTEEIMCENLFGMRIPGHRVVMKCTKATGVERKA